MPDLNTLISNYGLTIALILWFLYRETWPFIRDKLFPQWTKRQEDRVTERQKQSQDYQNQANEYRIFLLEELKSSRKDAKDDREATREVLRELKEVIESVTVQLTALTDKVVTLDIDIRSIYHIVGKDKQLLQ